MIYDYGSIHYIIRMNNLACILDILRDDFLFCNCYYEDALDEIDRYRGGSKGGIKTTPSRI